MPRARERVDEIIQVATRVADKAKFPIRDFKHISEALGGEEAEIEYEGKAHKVGQVRRLIPPEYFPIDSREDLIAKIADLQQRARPGWPGEVEPGEQLKEVPSDAGRPSVHESEFPKPGKETPMVKGWRKQQ